MTIPSKKAKKRIEELLNKDNLDEVTKQLTPEMPDKKELPSSIPGLRNWTREACQKRLDLIKNYTQRDLSYLTGEKTFTDIEDLKGNIENYIGMAQVPVGLIGPLRVKGKNANGDFYIPLSTTEGALVASYNRGASAVSRSGGVISFCLNEAVQRTPTFKFQNFTEVGQFLIWVMSNIEKIKEVVSSKTSHGKLEEVKPHIDGNQITLIFEYTTGDASGQNMVTICTFAACEYIVENSPVKPQRWLVEGNLSGDKKASSISFITVRGKKVTAEAVIKNEYVSSVLHSNVDDMLEAWKIAIINGIHSGSIGVNFHFANCLTAIFLACGQDVATVAEASIGTTRAEKTSEGDLYICVTLPNLIVGTVGGGTRFPTQRECLEIIDCYGSGKAAKFAEICAATALCGEISIIASMAAGDFARAHALFGRKNK